MRTPLSLSPLNEAYKNKTYALARVCGFVSSRLSSLSLQSNHR